MGYSRQLRYEWIIANSLGWGLGLGWIYLFASIPTEKSTMDFNVTVGIIGGGLAGISVGAIAGLYLVRLKEKENHSKQYLITAYQFVPH